MNDSQQPFNSRVDRHETIGNGTIGLEAFRLIMNDPHFRMTPKILETPKTSLADDMYNLEILRSLVAHDTKK